MTRAFIRLLRKLQSISWLIYLLVAFAALFIWLAITVPMGLVEQLMFGTLMFIAALIVGRLKNNYVSIFLIMMSIVASTRYLYWRFTESIAFESSLQIFLAGGLLAAEVYALLILVMGYFQVAWPLDRMPVKLPEDTSLWPTVDVFVPTYNEPLEVVRTTVIGALGIDWPADKLNVYVLDDGKNSALANFCSRVGVGYLTRPDNEGAKAGNINAALPVTNGDFIAIFDCDHIPARTFLKVNMGLFIKDEKLSLVQTPHHFYSADPFERNLRLFRKVPNEGELFYGLIQPGNDFWNAAFFCGSCAVIRRVSLLEVGGLATDTVTEDAHTSMNMHAKGWHSAYIPIPQAAGLATENISVHVGQRIRWARGMAQIFRVDNPLFKKGLIFGQRLCYFNSMFHFGFGLPRVVFLTAPIAFLLLDIHVINTTAMLLAVYVLPHLALAVFTSARVQGEYRHSFWAEVYETVLSTYLIAPTAMAFVDPKAGSFNVTAKGDKINNSYFDWDIAKPMLLLIGINLVGMAVGVWRLLSGEIGDATGTLILNMVWTSYNLIILGAAVSVCFESKQVRDHHRVPVAIPAMIRLNNGQTVHSQTIDISEGGLAFTLPHECDIKKDDVITLSLFSDSNDYPFEGRVAFIGHGRCSVNFDNISLENYKQLISILFGRPNAWVHWADDRVEDHPGTSFRMVMHAAKHGASNIIKLIFGREITEEPGISNASLKPEGTEESRNYRLLGWVLLLFLIAMLTWMSQTSHAATNFKPASNLANLTSPETVQTYELSDLGVLKPIRLRGVRGQRKVEFGVRSDDVVMKARLKVQYSQSPALIPSVSHINVLVNDFPVFSQRVGKGLKNSGVFEVDIDPNLLQGFNKLTFELIGHYTLTECEYPNHTSLWSVIDKKSTLTLTTIRQALKLDLSMLPYPFFDRHDPRQLNVPIVFPGSPTNTDVKAAAAIASWLGKEADYRGAKFEASIGSIPTKGNAIVLVVGKQMAPLPNITGPSVMMTRHPYDPHGTLLLVMGRDHDEMLLAAQGLAMGQFILSGQKASINNLDVPLLRKPYDAPRWLPSDRPVKFSELIGQKSLQTQGLMPAPILVDFRMPPDLFVWEDEGAELEFNYRNASPLYGHRGRLNVNFNEQYLGSYALRGAVSDKLYGSILDKIRFFFAPEGPSTAHITLPSDWFGYYNRLEFQYHIANDEGECKEVPDFFEGRIDPDSTIDISDTPHFVRMPHLGLFANGGFPFTRMADLSETLVIMPEQLDAGSLSAFLGIMGMFGASTGYPAIRVEVGNAADANHGMDKDIIIIGTYASLPMIDHWSEQMTFTLEDGRVHMKNPANFQFLPKWFTTSEEPDPFRPGGEIEIMEKTDFGIVTSFESPYKNGRTVLVVAGANGENVSRLADQFISIPEIKTIHGDTVIINDNNRITHLNLVDSYNTGHLPWWTWVHWSLSHSPITLMLVMLLAVFIFALLTYMLLRTRAKNRMKHER